MKGAPATLAPSIICSPGSDLTLINAKLTLYLALTHTYVSIHICALTLRLRLWRLHSHLCGEQVSGEHLSGYSRTGTIAVRNCCVNWSSSVSLICFDWNLANCAPCISIVWENFEREFSTTATWLWRFEICIVFFADIPRLTTPRPILMTSLTRRLYLLVVILQAWILSVADKGKKWHVDAVIGKIAELCMIVSEGVNEGGEWVS